MKLVQFTSTEKMKPCYITLLLLWTLSQFSIAQTWNDVGGGVASSTFVTSVSRILVDPLTDELMVWGVFDTVSLINVESGWSLYGQARWDGNNWSADSSGINNPRTFLYFQDTLYVGGVNIINGNNDTILGIAKWNGGDWETVGGGLMEGNGWTIAVVYTLEIFDNELYVGGLFTSLIDGDTVYNLAKWNGIKWAKAGSGTDGAGFSYVLNLQVYKSELYAGGNFNSMGSSNSKRISKWDGVVWSDIDSINGLVLALSVFENELYVGGRFTMVGVDSTSHIAKWNGVDWSGLGSGVKSIDTGIISDISALAIYQNELYAGGTFDLANGDAVSNIARWNGFTWQNVGSGVSDGVFSEGVNTMLVYQDDLYIGGHFITANGDTVNHIARWNSCSLIQPFAVFTQSEDVIDIADSTTIYFSNMDPLATSWLWDFGDGSSDTIANTSHEYNSSGVYTVTLIVYNENCSDTAYDTVTVVTNIGLQEGIIDNQKIKVHPNPFSGSTTVSISPILMFNQGRLDVHDISGRMVLVYQVFSHQNDLVISANEIGTGLFFLILKGSQGILATNKMIITH